MGKFASFCFIVYLNHWSNRNRGNFEVLRLESNIFQWVVLFISFLWCFILFQLETDTLAVLLKVQQDVQLSYLFNKWTHLPQNGDSVALKALLKEISNVVIRRWIQYQKQCKRKQCSPRSGKTLSMQRLIWKQLTGDILPSDWLK